MPTVAQRFEAGRYVDEHLAIFMPYIWVDDPIAFASGREVYGFAKTQGWMRRLGDPRASAERPGDPGPGPTRGAGPRRLRRRRVRRGLGARPPAADHAAQPTALGEGAPTAGVGRRRAPKASTWPPWSATSSRSWSRGRPGARARRFTGRLPRPAAPARGMEIPARVDRRAAVRAGRATRVPQADPRRRARRAGGAPAGRRGSLERLAGIAALAPAPGVLRALGEAAGEPSARRTSSGLAPEQTIRLAFAAEFGFRMEPGVVRWP